MTIPRRWTPSRSTIGFAVLSALAALLITEQPALAGDPTDGRALGSAPNSLGPRATQLGDVDGDGKADVFSYRASDSAWLVSYSGTSAWTTVAHGAIDPSTTWLADMNGDGKVDVFSFRASDQAWLVSYSANSSWQVINHAYLNPSVTRFGDTTGDGKADVFTMLTNGQWVRSSAGTGSWQVINGGAFQPTTTWVGDLNGDGYEDVVAIDTNYSWRVSYSGTSPWQTVNNGYLDPAWTQLVDINGDGKSDIFTIDSSGQWVVSYSGTSAWQVLNGGGLDPSRTWLADLDGDGHADLFTIQGLTKWVVSYSASGPWTEINNGYLPVDTPATTDPVIQQIIALSNPGTTAAQVVSIINDVIANHAAEGDSVSFNSAKQEVLEFVQATNEQGGAAAPPAAQNSCAWSVEMSANGTTVGRAGSTGTLSLVAGSDVTAPVYTGVVDGSNVTLTVLRGASQTQVGSVLANGAAKANALAQASLNGAVNGVLPEVNQTFTNLPTPTGLVPVAYKLQVGDSALERGVPDPALSSGAVARGGQGASADCVHSDTATTADAELNTVQGRFTIPSPSAAAAQSVTYPSTTTAVRYRTFIAQASADSGPICGKFEGDNRGFSSYYDESNRTRASVFFSWPTAQVDTSKHVGQSHRYAGSYVVPFFPYVIHYSDKRKTASPNGIDFHDQYMATSNGRGTYGRVGITHAVSDPLCRFAGKVFYNIFVDAWSDGSVRIQGIRGKMPHHEAYVYPHSEAYGDKILRGSAPASAVICLTINCGQVTVDASAS